MTRIDPFRRVAGLVMLPAVALATPVAADPPADPRHTLTIQLENDFLHPHSDKYYTNGFRIAYTSPTGQVPGFAASLGRSLFGAGQQRFALELSQHIFTPFANQVAYPPSNDRPYAGVLMATASLIQDTDSLRSVLGLGLGMIGPAALAREVQSVAHSVLRDTGDQGWGTQIPNQPVIQLTVQWIWRTAPLDVGSLQMDLLPTLGVGAGTFRIYGAVGAQFRIGQNLNVDFGVPRLRPGLTGTDAYHATQPLAWYLFLGMEGQAVAWDETQDGTPFGASRHVTKNPLVGELQGGLAVIAWGWRFTAAHIVRSQEFKGQRDGAFQFSSFSVSTKF